LKGFLEKHLNHVAKKSGPRCAKTALVESNVDKQRAGEKGGRNKTKYRPPKQQTTPAEVQKQSSQGLYTHIHHNDNPFVVRLLPEEAKLRNVRHATWTSATGNGMSLFIWYWSTKKGGTFRKRATGTTKWPQTKRENDITIQTYRNVRSPGSLT